MSSKPKKALLVGSSFSAAPLFFALKKRGLNVSVCGNIPSDPCHQYADESYFIDYSKTSELMRTVDEGDFDYLVPSCNDYAYMSCAAVAEKHGFPGYDSVDVANIIHTKGQFREAAKDCALPSPRFKMQMAGEPLDSDNLRMPLLVKPIDAFSGRGMTKIERRENLPEAIRHARQASRSGAVVLEEFIDGTLHSHSAYIQGQEIVVDFFVDEFCTIYPYQVNCSNHPSALPAEIRSMVRETILRFVRRFRLVDGLLHTQFLVRAGDFWIIESMRRCPGDLYGRLIELSSGVNYADLSIRAYLGLKLSSEHRDVDHHFFGRHTVSCNEPIVNFSFSPDFRAKSVDIVSLKNSGEKLGPAPFDKLAILFVEFQDRATMFDVTPRMAELVNIRKLEG